MLVSPSKREIKEKKLINLTVVEKKIGKLIKWEKSKKWGNI